jgi:SdpI/YhfL family protein
VATFARWRYLCVIATGYLASLAAYLRLPRTYYAIDDHLLPARPLIAFLLPTAAASIYALVHVVWLKDSVRDRDGLFEPTYDAILFAVAAFLIAVHLMFIGVLAGAVPARTWLARLTVILFGLVVVRVGNLLPRTRPNLALGIRTPKTLNDCRVWMQTNRMAGYAGVFLGTVIVVCGVFLSRGTIGAVIGPATIVAAAFVMLSHYKYSRG